MCGDKYHLKQIILFQKLLFYYIYCNDYLYMRINYCALSFVLIFKGGFVILVAYSEKALHDVVDGAF